jgi:hypothetical protein
MAKMQSRMLGIQAAMEKQTHLTQQSKGNGRPIKKIKREENLPTIKEET